MTTAVASMHPMDRMYRHQRHIYDLTRKWYLLGRDQMIAGLSPRPGDHVLEIGCGTGRNLVTAAIRYPDARFYGADVSTVMLSSARRAIARAGLTPRISVALADAAQPLPAMFDVAAYERIFISYALSMIPGWTAVLDGALSALAPGGELHIVDFGRQDDFAPPLRAALRAWLDLFGVTPRERLEAELAERGLRLHAALTMQRPYGGYAQHAVLRLRSP
jgi:S-adenosylmethionine-diacylgycerolhomoserine-N-methlytransferase